jgi:hypothetical protein
MPSPGTMDLSSEIEAKQTLFISALMTGIPNTSFDAMQTETKHQSVLCCNNSLL